MSRLLARARRIATSRTTLGILAGSLTVLLALAAVQETPLAPWIARPLELPDTSGPAQAIVVLGAGVSRGCTPDFHSVRRTVHAARLFRQGRAPVILFTGGRPPHRSCAIADAMAGLARELGVPAESILVERVSSTTWENAVEASKILGPRGIRKVLLISDSLHMRRGEACLRRFGFDVLRDAVPTEIAYYDGADLMKDAIHEYVGFWYYRLRGRI